LWKMVASQIELSLISPAPALLYELVVALLVCWHDRGFIACTSGGPRIPSRLGPNSRSEKLKTTIFILLKVLFLTFRIFI